MYHGNSIAQSPHQPSHRHCGAAVRSPVATYSLSKQALVSSKSKCFTSNCLGGPPLILLQFDVCLVLGDTKLDAMSRCGLKSVSMGQIILAPSLPVVFLFIQPWMQLVVFAVRADCKLNLLPTKTPTSFSAEMLSILAVSSLLQV